MFENIKRWWLKRKEMVLQPTSIKLIYKTIEENRCEYRQLSNKGMKAHGEDIRWLDKRINELVSLNLDFWMNDLRKRVTNLEKQNDN